MTATPPIVDRETWQKQIDTQRVREKAHAREGTIAEARWRLPMVEVDPTFCVALADLARRPRTQVRGPNLCGCWVASFSL
jgi:predicted dithiol-disulfide oxidoreductase (DUF899 family)